MKAQIDKDSNKEISASCRFKLIYVFRIPNSPDHVGLLKVGDATLHAKFDAKVTDFEPKCEELNKAARERINEYLRGVSYDLVYTEIAVDDKGKAFRDYEVHKVLKNSGVNNVKIESNDTKVLEWFDADLHTVKRAIKATKEGKMVIPGMATKGYSPIELRDEQKDAVALAVGYFSKERNNTKTAGEKKRDRGNEFLWNAKMRFGKTLCALKVVEELKARRTIIVTHRPDVRKGWEEDFHKVFDFYNKEHEATTKEQYVFGWKDGAGFDEIEKSRSPFVYFASMQDLTGSKAVSRKGVKNKNDNVLGANWDLIIVDEAHEGTQTDLGETALSMLKKDKTCVLHLSGTPFNLAEDFDDTNTFTWDYLKEQQAKLEWEKNHPGGPNPYASLPRMNIRTYSLGTLAEKYPDVAEKCFKFSEFFRIGQDEENFAHEDDVNKFLNLLAGKSPKTKTYPFSTDEYREFFRHTFWVVPGIKQGAALERLLKEHDVFKHFKVVNVCGEEGDDRAGRHALRSVEEAIERNHYTITLSCGKLTLGVSVPQWTAVLYLSGNYTTSAASYMQTIFRVQTPGDVDGKAKEECYVFDFAPDRALSVLHRVATIHPELSDEVVAQGGKESPGRAIAKEHPEPSHEEKVSNYLDRLITNFMPVIAVDGSDTCKIDTQTILEAVRRAYIADVVRKGFESTKLFNKKLDDLTGDKWKTFETLKGIIGRRVIERPDPNIPVNSEGLVGEERDGNGKKPPKKPPQPLSKEEKEKSDLKKKAISILLNATVKIPLLVFGTSAGEKGDKPEQEIFNDAKSFAEHFDDASWREFMGKLTKEGFLRMVAPYLDETVFKGACRRIRERAKAADLLPPKERIEKIVEIHSEFKNPDKETVLTPWRVVNMHLGDTLGGYNFYDLNYKKDILKEAEKAGYVANPRFFSNEVTKKTLENPNAKILEINSKTGLYPLYVAYSLMRAKLNSRRSESMPNAEKQTWKEVVEKNIFIICRTKMAAAITRRTLLGFDAGAKANIRVDEKLVEKAADLLYEEKSEKKEEERLKRLEKFLKEIKTWEDEKMEFNAVVGNPPYQKLDEGKSGGSSASPLYHHVLNLAKELKPEFISLIIPSRWFASGKGLGDFRKKMLEDKHIKILHDFTRSQDVFPNVDIMGGVCYFLWDRGHDKKCSYSLHDFSGKRMTAVRFLETEGSDVVIRYTTCIEIFKKIMAHGEKSFSSVVSERKPFGLATDFFKNNKEELKDSEDPEAGSKKFPIGILGLSEKKARVEKYVRADFFHHENKSGKMVIDRTIEEYLKAHKIFIPYAYGCATIGETASTPVLGAPIPGKQNSACTETFLLIGPFETEKEANNALSYLKTKTFRLLVGLRKNTQHGTSDTYLFVPMQDFSEPWTDEKLYKKYKFTEEEKAFIKKMIGPIKQ